MGDGPPRRRHHGSLEHEVKNTLIVEATTLQSKAHDNNAVPILTRTSLTIAHDFTDQRPC
jgi:hypothetical protein